MNTKVKKVHWNTSQDCNLECEFCYLWRHENIKPLSTQTAKELIKQTAENNAEWFVFGGGDPLMRRDLPQLLKCSKEIGLKTDVQTNALLLNDDLFDSIYKYVDRFGLSIDGENETIHDSLRKHNGHLNNILKALDKCEQASIPVVVRTTVLKPNLGKLNGIGKILVNYSCVRKWSVREFAPLGKGLLNKSKFYIGREMFLREVNEIILNNSKLLKIPIIPVTSDEMNNCYCLVTAHGLFYTHPQEGSYSSYGAFPLESMRTILSRLEYNVSRRQVRDYKEELALCVLNG